MNSERREHLRKLRELAEAADVRVIRPRSMPPKMPIVSGPTQNKALCEDGEAASEVRCLLKIIS